jgi:hypothetical protein
MLCYGLALAYVACGLGWNTVWFRGAPVVHATAAPLEPFILVFKVFILGTLFDLKLLDF